MILFKLTMQNANATALEIYPIKGIIATIDSTRTTISSFFVLYSSSLFMTTFAIENPIAGKAKII